MCCATQVSSPPREREATPKLSITGTKESERRDACRRPAKRPIEGVRRADKAAQCARNQCRMRRSSRKVHIRLRRNSHCGESAHAPQSSSRSSVAVDRPSTRHPDDARRNHIVSDQGEVRRDIHQPAIGKCALWSQCPTRRERLPCVRYDLRIRHRRRASRASVLARWQSALRRVAGQLPGDSSKSVSCSAGFHPGAASASKLRCLS